MHVTCGHLPQKLDRLPGNCIMAIQLNIRLFWEEETYEFCEKPKPNLDILVRFFGASDGEHFEDLWCFLFNQFRIVLSEALTTNS
jgi:hypothetical protein